MGYCCVSNQSKQTVNFNKLDIINIQRKKSDIKQPIYSPKSPKRRSFRESIYVLNNENICKKYDFEAQIGAGFYGTVRIAFPKNDPTKRYAVKSIEKSKLSPQKIANLSREIEILSLLDHPNIIKYYETYNDKEYFHIIMEYCSGGELFERICDKSHKFTEFEASSIIYKLMSAISYIHATSIVHRDIKPENILYENKNFLDIKLIDFGLSKKFISEDLHSIVGSPYYVAPEVLDGKYDSKCDIWGLGVLTYVLLCGNPPFHSKDRQTIFYKIKNEELKFEPEKIWKNVSAEAKNLVTKMLNKNPKDRPRANVLLDHKWFIKIQEQEFSFQKIEPEIFENLKKFHQPLLLSKAILKFIVKELKHSDIEKLKTAFMIIDDKKTGLIDYEQLKNCCIKCGIPLENEEISSILNNCKLNSIEEKIDYSSFIAAAINKKKLLNKNILWEAFKHFDAENEGFLTIQGMEKAMKRTGKTDSIDRIQFMFREAGYGLDANINFTEFCKLLERDIDH